MKNAAGFLGLCCRAGQVTAGADLALREIKAGRAGLALIDEGASPGTRKKILDACDYREVPARMLPQGEISRCCGKEDRMAAAVKKGKMCERLLELIP